MKDKILKQFLLAVAIPFGILCVSNSVSAYTIPEICQDTLPLRAYDLGLYKGSALIEKEWNKINNNCTTLVSQSDFEENVLGIFDDLSIPPNSPDHVICHYYGYINGISDRLKEIDYTCPEQCLLDGEFVGEIAARFYCELSIAFDGITNWDFIESILSVCESEMVDTCKNTFGEISTTYINVFDVQCEPYTQVEYDWVWLMTREKQCKSVP